MAATTICYGCNGQGYVHRNCPYRAAPRWIVPVVGDQQRAVGPDEEPEGLEGLPWLFSTGEEEVATVARVVALPAQWLLL